MKTAILGFLLAFTLVSGISSQQQPGQATAGVSFPLSRFGLGLRYVAQAQDAVAARQACLCDEALAGDRASGGSRVWIGCWGWVPIRLRYSTCSDGNGSLQRRVQLGKRPGVRLGENGSIYPRPKGKGR